MHKTLNLLGQYRRDLLALLAGVILFSAGLLRAYFVLPYNSDDVGLKALLHQSLQAHNLKVLVPDDTYLLKIPFNVVLDSIVHRPNLNLFLSGWIQDILIVIVFYFVAIYFLRRLTTNRNSELIFIPLFLYLCSNSSVTFLSSIRSPQVRSIEIAVGFICLWLLDKIIIAPKDSSWTKKKALKILLTSLLTGLLLFSDPAYILFLIVPISIVGLVVYVHKSEYDKFSQLIAYSAASMAVYSAILLLAKDLGVQVLKVNAAFVAWNNLGSNISIALNGLLYLENAQIFGEQLYKASTVLAALNLAILLFATLYIPAKIFKLRSFWLTFFAIQPAFIFGIYALSTNVVNISTSRYLILIPFYAVLMIAIIISGYYKKLNTQHLIIGAVFIVLALAQFCVNLSSISSNRHDQQNASSSMLARAVEQTGDAKGYASYWDANIVSFYSNYYANIFPLNCSPDGFTINYWIFNTSSLHKATKDSFIIVSGTIDSKNGAAEALTQPANCNDSDSVAIRQFGYPSRIISVSPGTQIYTYDYDLLSKIPNRMQSSVAQ